ncbi:MAG: calcium/sodium antiporter [bacterium]|nr:calcium/sodium antiporter [bacterium]
MLIPILLIILGLGILIVGGEILVKGSASVAKRLNISPIVIGLTIVAFGTSAPELVVNIFSALKGAPDIAIGNILGSNIANILLVLGISSIIYPLTVKEGTTWKEIPFAILVVLVLFLLVNDVLFGNSAQNILTRGDGLILISFFVIFMYYTYSLAKVKGDVEEQPEKFAWSTSILFIIGGIICLVLGGKLMVDNGIILARLAGMSELLIGLTIVAVGTSLPELATSIIAAYKKHDEIAIGNVVGSNIFNVLWILGVTPIVHSIDINEMVNIDLFITLVATCLLFAYMFVGNKGGKYTLTRWQGISFVLLYIIFTGYVFIRG